MQITRGGPKDSQAIADLINRLGPGASKLIAEDVMADFGEKAYMLLRSGDRLVGVVGWQVENLVVRVTSFDLEPGMDAEKGLESLITEVEHASTDLQCEVALVFPPKPLAEKEALWKKLGYIRRTPATLGVQAWTDAALESMPKDGVLFFKPLRKERVLRPI